MGPLGPLGSRCSHPSAAGLQSDSGEHRLCWSCLFWPDFEGTFGVSGIPERSWKLPRPKHVDWQHFRDNA